MSDIESMEFILRGEERYLESLKNRIAQSGNPEKSTDLLRVAMDRCLSRIKILTSQISKMDKKRPKDAK